MKFKEERWAIEKFYKFRTKVDLNPWWQREYIWKKPESQLLMDSIIKKLVLPKVYLRLSTGTNFQCIDGQQRLESIITFISGKYELGSAEPSIEGKEFKNLPSAIKNRFLKYKIDTVIVKDTTESEITELFKRLQLGKKLNSPEKLHAMSGGLRNFVVDHLSKHKFFNKIALRNVRYSHEQIAAQLMVIEMNGISNVKFKDLSKEYDKNQIFERTDEHARKIIKTLNLMKNSLPVDATDINNRANVVSFYLLFKKLSTEINVKQKAKEITQKYVRFLKDVQKQAEKGIAATNSTLLNYQSNVIQGADSKGAINNRHLIIMDKVGNQFLN